MDRGRWISQAPERGRSRKEAVVTREQKLALLIGFSLSLAVGVLISDHVSKGGAAELDAQVAVVGDPAPRAVPWIETPTGLVADAAGSTPPRPPRSAKPAPSERTEVVAAERSTPTVVAPGRIVGVSDRPTVFIAPLGHRPEPRVATRDDGSIGRRSAEDVPAKYPVHYVREGESLFAISKAYYGTGHAWKKLAAFNEDRIAPDGTLRVGVRLRIPPADELGYDGAEDRGPASDGSDEPGTRYGTYQVRKGDTLGELASKLMGTVRKTDELLELNSDVIRNPNMILPGTVLRYPLGPDA